jgi:hypothetical protein
MGCSSIHLSSLWPVGNKEKKARCCKEKIPVVPRETIERGLLKLK